MQNGPLSHRSQIWLGNRARDKFSEAIPRRIWTFWNSDEFPLIVRACFRSWRETNPDHEIICVTPTNAREYLKSLPENLESESPQRQSDFIRLCLMKEHGGIWMDATTLAFESLDYIHYLRNLADAEFIGYFHATKTTIAGFPLIENWFLASPPSSRFVTDWQAEFTYSIMHGSVKYVETVGKRIDIKQLQQGLPQAPYFSCHIAAQLIMRRDNPYRLGLIAAEDDAFRLARHCNWEEGKVISELTSAGGKPMGNIFKIIGRLWRPLEQALQDGKYDGSSIIGRLVQS